MKKPVVAGIIALSAALMVLVWVGQSQAVSTECWNCHTMHNSQDNEAMAYDAWGPDASATGPQPALLRSSCEGCHSYAASSSQVAIYEGKPIVYNTGGYPVPALAGGNFYWVGAGLSSSVVESRAHNCSGVAAADSTLTTPPGFATDTGDPSRAVPLAYRSSYTGTWGTSSWTGHQVTCAGTYGCHGDRRDATGYEEPLTGLQGAHHGNAPMDANQVCTGTTLGNSYRFLAGIKGVEQNGGATDSWEVNAASDNHNAYYGADRVTASADALTETISFLCAECHGDFHNTAGIARDDDGTPIVSRPWLRHPTDIYMPNSGEFADYYTATYNPVVPLGFTSPAVTDTASRPGAGSGVVMCVSCHRAHGSPYADLLRWEYAEGSGLPDLPTSSCGTCHTDKVGGP